MVRNRGQIQKHYQAQPDTRHKIGFHVQHCIERIRPFIFITFFTKDIVYFLWVYDLMLYKTFPPLLILDLFALFFKFLNFIKYFHLLLHFNSQKLCDKKADLSHFANKELSLRVSVLFKVPEMMKPL